MTITKTPTFKNNIIFYKLEQILSLYTGNSKSSFQFHKITDWFAAYYIPETQVALKLWGLNRPSNMSSKFMDVFVSSSASLPVVKTTTTAITAPTTSKATIDPNIHIFFFCFFFVIIKSCNKWITWLLMVFSNLDLTPYEP